MIDKIFFNVGLGQCIFGYPRNNTDYTIMIDCGDTPDFKPVDFLIEKNLFPKNGQKHVLNNLTLTNYDHDHYSGLAYLREKVKIETTKFPKNLTAEEIDEIKPDKTTALEAVIDVRKTYTSSVENHNPPYTKNTFYLNKEDFESENVGTNDLSQLVFLTYNGTTICVPGDLEKNGWELMLKKAKVKELLGQTDVYVASHHGRDNGYVSEIFEHCKPECVIMSDKHIIHGTQENTASMYGKIISGDGITLNGDSTSNRKVLTTRNDKNIWLRVEENGTRTYKSFA